MLSMLRRPPPGRDLLHDLGLISAARHRLRDQHLHQGKEISGLSVTAAQEATSMNSHTKARWRDRVSDRQAEMFS